MSPSDRVSIRLGGGAAGFNWLPVYLAERRGLFERGGLKVEIHRLGSVDKATTAVKDGSVDLAITPPEGTIKDCAGGGNLRIVGSNAVRLPLTLVAKSQYRRIEELRGAKLGTSSMTEGTALYTIEMLARHGLRYPGDYEFAVVGVHPARWKALQEGTIDAAVQPPPFNFLATDAGFSDLGEVSDYVPEILFTAIIADHGWAERHERPLVAFLEALMQATRWFYDRTYDRELEALTMEVTQSNADHARRSVEYLRDKGTFLTDLSVPHTALSTSIEMMRKAAVADDALLARAGAVVIDKYRTAAATSA